MSELPTLIVVTGTPVNDAMAEARKWSILLFLSQLAYFLFNASTKLYGGDEDSASSVLTHAFTFCLCGVYLPLALYNNARRKNTRLVCFISMLILLCSLMTVLFDLNSICTFYDIQQICQDCQDDFRDYNGTCDMTMQGAQQNYAVTVTQDECESVPDSSMVIVRHMLEWFVAMIGVIAAFKVQHTESSTKTYANVLTPHTVSVVGVTEQPVAPDV